LHRAVATYIRNDLRLFALFKKYYFLETKIAIVLQLLQPSGNLRLREDAIYLLNQIAKDHYRLISPA
jgi:hypothetical protein